MESTTRENILKQFKYIIYRVGFDIKYIRIAFTIARVLGNKCTFKKMYFVIILIRQKKNLNTLFPCKSLILFVTFLCVVTLVRKRYHSVTHHHVQK